MFAVSARTGASDRLVSRLDARREFSVPLARAFPLARVHRVVVDDGFPGRRARGLARPPREFGASSPRARARAAMTRVSRAMMK
jgi:hypothetical protein